MTVIEKDLLGEYPTALRADQKGVNVLILRKVNPTKRLDGKVATYSLEHQWLRDAENHTSVQGSDVSYWTTKEIDWEKDLFDQVNLF